MQIRQLEALQVMAKSAGSKVIFVPMSLIGEGSSGGAMFNEDGPVASGSGEGRHTTGAIPAAILNSMSNV
jgi:hypothetical protein